MAAKLVLLGMGKMGGAMALRLREKGHHISIWNRTAAKATAVKEEAAQIGENAACELFEDSNAAVQHSSPDSTVILIVSDTAACFDTLDSIKSQLNGRTVVNLTSGSPDDGRKIAAALADTNSAYIDGAYCGPPAKARAGSGILFLSAEQQDDVERLRPTLEALGEVAFAGTKIGSSRALDYAVVDLALVCYNSYFSNLAMLEQEGVDQALVREHAAKRLATVAPALGLLHARAGAAQRSDDEYKAKPIVTLQTLRGWWSGRLPYLEARGIPTEWPRFMAGLAERASEGGHETADVTRHLEVMRPPKEAGRGVKRGAEEA